MTTPNTAKDLSKEAPSSPRVRVGGYVILSRMTDKGRALLNGTLSDYHFDCPLDNYLFGFKGVKGDEVKEQLQSGASDEEIAAWLDAHGTPKSPAEVKVWSDAAEGFNPVQNPDMKEWFEGECAKVGLDPSTSTLFDFLETDDRLSYTQ